MPRASFIATMDTAFRSMDADKNGVVTKREIEEFQRASSRIAVETLRRALFTALDSNKDGIISPAEFARLPVQSPEADAAPVIAQADLNRDGSISLVEYRTAKLANFDRIDTDKDGVVSVTEMKAAGIVK